MTASKKQKHYAHNCLCGDCKNERSNSGIEVPHGMNIPHDLPLPGLPPEPNAYEPAAAVHARAARYPSDASTHRD